MAMPTLSLGDDEVADRDAGEDAVEAGGRHVEEGEVIDYEAEKDEQEGAPEGVEE